MIRFQTNPAYDNLLQENGLASFNELMAINSGSFFEQDEQRDVQRLELGQQAFFLKRVNSEKFSSAFESYLGGKLAHSKPFKEMLHFRFLRECEFDVAEVVAVGEKLHYGIPLSGFILTREVPGQDLSSIYQSANGDDREQIMRSFGALVGKLHVNGFFGSIRLKDIICNGNPGESMKMTLIDREVRNPWPRTPTRAMILRRILVNARRQVQQGEIVRAEEWAVFTRYYCSSLTEAIKIETKVLMQEIERMLQKKARD